MVYKLLETVSGIGIFDRKESISWSLIEEISSSFATFWSHVDDVVSIGDDI